VGFRVYQHLAVLAPGRVHLEQDVLGGVHDDGIEGAPDHHRDWAGLLLGRKSVGFRV